jgi:drug/metabolite transporter (DMT)-like permease
VYLNQFLFYNGLALTNATFASVMQILVPVFTLIIAAIYRLKKIPRNSWFTFHSVPH